MNLKFWSFLFQKWSHVLLHIFSAENYCKSKIRLYSIYSNTLQVKFYGAEASLVRQKCAEFENIVNEVPNWLKISTPNNDVKWSHSEIFTNTIISNEGSVDKLPAHMKHWIFYLYSKGSVKVIFRVVIKVLKPSKETNDVVAVKVGRKISKQLKTGRIGNILVVPEAIQLRGNICNSTNCL